MPENKQNSIEWPLDQNVLDLLEVKITRSIQERFVLLPSKWVAVILSVVLVTGGFSGWLAVREAARSALETAGAQQAIKNIKDIEVKASAFAEQILQQQSVLNGVTPVGTVLPYAGDLETGGFRNPIEAAAEGREVWAKGATNWFVCNGATNILGGKLHAIPDLRDRFLKGVSSKKDEKVRDEGGSNTLINHIHGLTEVAGLDKHLLCIIGNGTGTVKMEKSARGKQMEQDMSLGIETGGWSLAGNAGKQDYLNAPSFTCVYYLIRIR